MRYGRSRSESRPNSRPWMCSSCVGAFASFKNSGRDKEPRMRFANRLTYVALVTGLVLHLSSCSSSRKSSAEDTASSSHLSPGQLPSSFYTPPHAVYEVTYTPNTVRIDFPTTQRLLRS